MRASLFLCVGLLCASAVLPQERQPVSREAAQVNEQGDPWIWWKWANFLILAGVLGYLINKNAGAMYRGQAEAIRRGITEAAKVKQDAEARAAQIENRLAGIQTEIEAMRSQARAEMAAEADRINQETTRHLSRLQQQSEQEIELMSKAARQQLKAYSAELALQLAERQVRGRMSKETQDALVKVFIQDLQHGTRPGAPAQ